MDEEILDWGILSRLKNSDPQTRIQGLEKLLPWVKEESRPLDEWDPGVSKKVKKAAARNVCQELIDDPDPAVKEKAKEILENT